MTGKEATEVIKNMIDRESVAKALASTKEGVYMCDVHIVALQTALGAMAKAIPKRVTFKEFSGFSGTRYYCPTCKKQAKHNTAYCDKCGQALIFPGWRFSDYVPGEKQTRYIVWEDGIPVEDKE